LYLLIFRLKFCTHFSHPRACDSHLIAFDFIILVMWQRVFPLASVSRPALGPTQPLVQWVPGVLSQGVKRGQGVTLTTHPHLVPRSRMSRSYISSPPKRLHGV
jgi:hypothetical protein